MLRNTLYLPISCVDEKQQSAIAVCSFITPSQNTNAFCKWSEFVLCCGGLVWCIMCTCLSCHSHSGHVSVFLLLFFWGDIGYRILIGS